MSAQRLRTSGFVGTHVSLLVALAVIVVGVVFLFLRNNWAMPLGTSKPKQSGSITILWAEWKPSEYLRELVKDFTKETGIEVIVQTEPWPTFQNKAFKELCRNPINME